MKNMKAKRLDLSWEQWVGTFGRGGFHHPKPKSRRHDHIHGNINDASYWIVKLRYCRRLRTLFKLAGKGLLQEAEWVK